MCCTLLIFHGGNWSLILQMDHSVKALLDSGDVTIDKATLLCNKQSMPLR